MKKLLIVGLTALIFYSCGRGEYNVVNRNSNSYSQQTTTQVTTDPADSFTNKWIAEADSVATTDKEIRTLANFFGFNTTHYANKLDSCFYGYKDAYSMVAAPKFSSTDYLRNYFKPVSNFAYAFPAPMDLGDVSNYKIRFAANVNQATGIIQEGNAYLELTLDATNAPQILFRNYTIMKTALHVTLSGGDQIIKATWSDDCGDVTFTAKEVQGVLENPVITFKKTSASYKKAKCYWEGSLPNGGYVQGNYDLDSITSVPDGIDLDSTSSRGQIFWTAGIVDFIHQ